MTTTDELLAQLAKSPGWQKLSEAAKKEETKMAKEIYEVQVEDFSWVVNNIEQPGNGRITMSRYAEGSAEIELPNGNILEVTARRLAGRNTAPISIEEAIETTPDRDIVRYVAASQIKIMKPMGRPPKFSNAAQTSITFGDAEREALAKLQGPGETWSDVISRVLIEAAKLKAE